MSWLTTSSLVLGLLFGDVARADDAPAESEVTTPTSPPAPVLTGDDDDEVLRPIELRNVPPRFSWDLALMPSYGMHPEFTAAPPWLGLGVRGEWGRHYGPAKNHRVGFGFGFSAEGAISVQ